MKKKKAYQKVYLSLPYASFSVLSLTSSCHALQNYYKYLYDKKMETEKNKECPRIQAL